MMEAIRSSETYVLTRSTQRHIPGDDILHSHCRETSNLAKILYGFTNSRYVTEYICIYKVFCFFINKFCQQFARRYSTEMTHEATRAVQLYPSVCRFKAALSKMGQTGPTAGPWSQQVPVRRMVSSGMLRRVALVRTDVSEEPSASFIRVTRIGELETTLAVTACGGC
jgi:hypothetical protein